MGARPTLSQMPITRQLPFVYGRLDRSPRGRERACPHGSVRCPGPSAKALRAVAKCSAAGRLFRHGGCRRLVRSRCTAMGSLLPLNQAQPPRGAVSDPFGVGHVMQSLRDLSRVARRSEVCPPRTRVGARQRRRIGAAKGRIRAPTERPVRSLQDRRIPQGAGHCHVPDSERGLSGLFHEAAGPGVRQQLAQCRSGQAHGFRRAQGQPRQPQCVARLDDGRLPHLAQRADHQNVRRLVPAAWPLRGVLAATRVPPQRHLADRLSSR